MTVYNELFVILSDTLTSMVEVKYAYRKSPADTMLGHVVPEISSGGGGGPCSQTEAGGGLWLNCPLALPIATNSHTYFYFTDTHTHTDT